MDFKCEKLSWSKVLKKRDLYYKGLIDTGNLENILKDHKRSTITSYGMRTNSNVTAPQAAIKPEKTAVDSIKDDKCSVAIKNAVNKNKV